MDSVTPTLAFSEARALCADMAALMAHAQVTLDLPGAAPAGSEPTMHYDELVRMRLTLTLPAMPARLPPPARALDAPLTLHDAAEMPHLLFSLLKALCITLRGQYGTNVVFTRQWQGAGAPADFALAAAEAADDVQREPWKDAAHVPGVVFDATARVWKAHWLGDVSVAYPSARDATAALVLEAVLQLRLDLVHLAASSDAPPPQAPVHFSSVEVHPAAQSTDPYFIDVDLLHDLTEGVAAPDETPEQRHAHIAAQLCQLPLSSLARGAGVDIVSPWGEALALAKRLQRAKELEAVAMASDADIALAPFSADGAAVRAAAPRTERPALPRQTSLPDKPTDAAANEHARPRDISALAASGVLVLTRRASLTAQVRPTVLARMRTLNRLFTRDNGQSCMLVCVELEGSAADTFHVHALSIDVGAPVRGEAGDALGVAAHTDGLVQPVVELLSHGDASRFPIVLGPHSQHNLLYAVRLECLEPEPGEAARALAAWQPQRQTRVTMAGAPQRAAASAHSTCATQWHGAMDLGLARLALERDVFAAHVLQTSTGYMGRVAGAASAPLVAGAATLAASALAATQRTLPPPPKERSEQIAPPADAAGPRCALAWSQSDAVRGFDPARVTTLDGAFLATVEIEGVGADASLAHGAALVVRVVLHNVSEQAVDVDVAWVAQAPAGVAALLPDHSQVHLRCVCARRRLTQDGACGTEPLRRVPPVGADARCPEPGARVGPRRQGRLCAAGPRHGVCSVVSMGRDAARGSYAREHAQPAHELLGCERGGVRVAAAQEIARRLDDARAQRRRARRKHAHKVAVQQLCRRCDALLGAQRAPLFPRNVPRCVELGGHGLLHAIERRGHEAVYVSERAERAGGGAKVRRAARRDAVGRARIHKPVH